MVKEEGKERLVGWLRKKERGERSQIRSPIVNKKQLSND